MVFRKLAVVAALISAPLLTVGTLTAAEASTQHFTPVPTARGNVALAGPLQYAQFVASASQRGAISYTNFESPATSNVWNISGATSLTFTLGSSSYAHTLDVASITPLSPVASAFQGTGFYQGNTATTWTIHGFVVFNHVDFRILYTGGPDAGYKLQARGIIAPDGSVTGQALDSNGNTLGFSMPAGSAVSVLHYRAAVTCAVIRPFHHSFRGGNATFGFTIPSYAPAGLAGLLIVVKVHDGGPGPARDTWAHGVATSPCRGPVTQYQITSGNITVRR
jgi:hypothetical protein